MKICAVILTALSTASSVSAFQAGIPVSAQRSGTALNAVEPSGRRAFLQSAALVGGLVVPQLASAEPRPMYLTEPTDEFKANEAKAMEFKRQQLMAKKEFQAALEKITTEGNNAEALVKDLKDLQALVARTGGLPLGIKKEDVFKQIRSKKAKGFWPTEVEIAYQSLIAEISFQQSPNLDKEFGNPYQ